MDEVQLRNFLMIGRCASITEAADRLGIAQPSLSQQLLRLEDEMGTQLFKRTSRGVKATDAGRMLQEHADSILRAMNRAREQVHDAECVPVGQVAIGLPGTASLILGVPLLTAARTELSSVKIHVREAMSGTIRNWLEEGRIELGILYDAETMTHLSGKVIARESLLVVGPPGAFGMCDEFGIACDPVDHSSLTGRDFILPSVSHNLRKLIERRLHIDNVSVAIEIDSLAHTKTLVAEGLGWTLLSHAAIRNELSRGELSAAHVDGIDLSRSVAFVRNPAQTLTRASIAVEDLANKLLREMIADGRWVATPVNED
jgi:LysR family transcriptional regulator, nitrogen assimilation regulatory protein